MDVRIKMGLGVAAVAALLCACSSERLETTAPSADALSQSSANAITVDEALKDLDGYILHRYDLIKRYYKNNELIKTAKESESTVHVHCDFGWKDGLNNGYFTSGIFDLAVAQEWDGNRDSTIRHNYNWYLKTITYDAPIKE